MNQKPAFGPEKHPAGATIIHQGDESDKFYIITRGRVEIIVRQENGRQSVIDTLEAGDYFGEVGIMTKQRRMATVRALTDLNLMAMDRATFARWLKSSEIIQQEIVDLVKKRMPKPEKPQTQFLNPEQVALPTMQKGFFEIEAIKHMESYKPRQVIVHQGEIADKFFVIVDGRVEVLVAQGEQKVVINELGKGDYFGEVGLLEKSTRIATVRAKTAVKVVTFDRDTFASWLKENPTSQDEISTVATQRLIDTGRHTGPLPDLFENEEETKKSE